MDRCRVPFETNGDLSHYVYRGLRSSGPGSEDVQRILERMGHTHQRMARPFGDLSAVVEDPAGAQPPRRSLLSLPFAHVALDSALLLRLVATPD